MFEHHSKPLISKAEYQRRVLRNFFLASLIVIISLLFGTIGYHLLDEMSWIDSFYNASMILTGMGPVNVLHSSAAKLFSSFYAIFSGVAFLSTIAIFLAPVIHRFMHKFHLEEE